LSPKQVKREFGFTCPECHFVPDRDSEDDFVRTHRISKKTGERATRNVRWPVRCQSCERNKKRYQRMRRRLEKVWEASWAQPAQIYRRPKLITFALPSIWTFNESGEDEMKRLNKLLPRAREILLSNNVKGGSYVLECTTRSHEGIGATIYKHHAHVHMVAVAPYVHRTKLKAFCEQLMPLGLGRINYVAPRGKYKEAVSQVAGYISKYLVKDKRTTRTFGIMRGWHTLPKTQQDPVSQSKQLQQPSQQDGE
jgi:hypothetical protein